MSRLHYGALHTIPNALLVAGSCSQCQGNCNYSKACHVLVSAPQMFVTKAQQDGASTQKIINAKMTFDGSFLWLV